MKRLTVIVALLLAAAPAAFAQPSITFKGNQVIATGVTAGGSAVCFGVARERGGWVDHVYHFRTVANDDDQDGKVVFSQEKAIPTWSVLVVVDVERGDFAAGTAAEPGLAAARPLASDRLRYGPTGTLEALTETASRLDVLLVRRGEGAWAARIFDGGPLDADAVRDGAVSVAFAALEPIGATARATDGAHPGDVLVLIDPETLRYSAVHVTARAQ